MEGELEPRFGAIVIIVANERDHLSVGHVLPPGSGFLHFTQFLLIIDCSVPHLGQAMVSLWPQESQ
jgi:hypothetical protein